ncbi:hypothetical protein RJ55_03236 [Drechmeria coniospora]|nr:hypothetical protein RJ55_03236 [Drechmeria coniospora]
MQSPGPSMEESEDHTPSLDASEEEIDHLGELDADADADAVLESRRRVATIYDAVAGRVLARKLRRAEEETDDLKGPTAQGQQGQARLIKHYTRPTPLGPDEALFRRKDAPERYAQHDVYNAHDRDFAHGGRGVLPESDLLKAVHGYASSFYGALDRRRSRLAVPDGQPRSANHRSMDETALLAFGILLEEAGREVLGRRGAMVFAEAADDGGGDDENLAHAAGTSPSGNELATDSDSAASCSSSRRGRKRRRVTQAEE